MHAGADRLEFAPPQPPGMLRAFVLAVLAHLLLLLALTYGLRWQRETPVVAAEAELWSKLPVEAAPKVEAPPPVPTPVPPAPEPPKPVVKAPPQPDPQVQRDAEIALEREREKREAAQRHQAELEKERDRKRKLEAQRRHDEELARLQEEKLEKLEKLEKQRKQEKQEKLERQEQARLQAEAKRKDDEKKQRQQEQQDKKLAQMREENIKRNLAMAGTGAPGATGTAARASGPSGSWAGRVVARVRPNIVFTDDISGNPKAEVEVRTSPDGTIVGKRLVHSSGSKAWDDAVLRALDKTESLPRDIDGRVPSPVVIEFRPKG